MRRGSWSLVECCAGAAALTVHLLGGKVALLPYQGSKWKVRKELGELLRHCGLEGPPSYVWLNDHGPFGRTWEAVVRFPDRVADAVESFVPDDPHGLFLRFNHALVPDDPVLFAAEHLFLQRLTVNGKAVLVREGRWNSPGFNKSSAYGCAGTERFGQVKPMIPYLGRTVRQTGRLFDRVETTATTEDAFHPTTFLPMAANEGPVVFFVDPPYEGTTGYGAAQSFDLSACVDRLLAIRQGLPTLVVVTESKAISLSGDHSGMRLREPTKGKSPFRSTAAEWASWKTSAEWLVAGVE